MFQVGIFAKYWEPGQVKTRLAASIGQAEAAKLYRAFVETLLDRFGQAPYRRVLAYWPSERARQFEEVAGDRWHLEAQSAGNLGQRMTDYFANAAAAGATRTVLIGSDSPTLPLEIFEVAFRALESVDVVLGPSEDGGYYLVGVSRSVTSIFDGVEWSSSRVFEQTVKNISQSKLTWSALPTFYDIDDLSDLERLKDELCRYHGEEGEALARLGEAVDRTLQRVNRHA